jgi:hypothetical protein
VVIYSPSGKSRKRFPEGVVEVYASETEALAHADPEKAAMPPSPAAPRVPRKVSSCSIWCAGWTEALHPASLAAAAVATPLYLDP